MDLRQTASLVPDSGDAADRDAGSSGVAVVAMWVAGLGLLALLLTIGFLGYTNPAMLIEFASLRLCG